MDISNNFLNFLVVLLPVLITIVILMFLLNFFKIFLKSFENMILVAEQKVQEYKNKTFLNQEEKHKAKEELIKELIRIKYTIHWRLGDKRGKIDELIALL